MNKKLIEKIIAQKKSDKLEDQLYMENHYIELIQHCYLFALSKTDFFTHAAFHGGTCLRVVNKIDRFSEDLDFAVISPGMQTDTLAAMLNEAANILKSIGLPLELTHNKINNSIQKAWIKEGVLAKEFLNENPKYAIQNGKSKIKIEIDLDPPKGSTYENVPIDFPENFNLTIQDHSSSFSGKLHAVLCRDFFYNNDGYIKGRDYFDLDWYLTHKIQPNYDLLKSALFKAGPYQGLEIKVSQDWLHNELEKKLKSLNWDLARKDMTSFLLSTSFDQIGLFLNADSMIKKLNISFT